jgi:solute carrier family 10 (sodium/bile acid cotransporter), member 7
MKKYWFLLGLLVIFSVTLFDGTETVSGIGARLKTQKGPEIVMFLIFFFSGLILRPDHIRTGASDIRGILITLSIIFLVSPLVVLPAGMLPLDPGIKIGLFLVAAMPTTLSSGVVMTTAAGGNMAQALIITILANGLAVFTVPVSLSLLLRMIGGSAVIAVDRWAIVTKLFFLVLVPLGAGLVLKFYAGGYLRRIEEKLQTINQCLVLCIVWMALSQTRDAILDGGGSVGIILVAVSVFHIFLLASAAVSIRLFKLPPGRREPVIFMGGQKTLPLSVILQVSLFPQYGIALIVCVIHHLIHLLMDGYLVGKLRGNNNLR